MNMEMSSLSGILPVLKPPGMTSHDVVASIRRRLKGIKTGHAGTLDPEAAGLLVIGLGKGTKALRFMDDMPKRYRAEMRLGISTDTHDATGRVTAVNRDFKIGMERVNEALKAFTGKIQQIPPMFSAVHHEGRRLYELAREGKSVEREPRPITVYEISVFCSGGTCSDIFSFGDRILLDISVSKGTYIRTLCHDIGEALGTHAYMSFLIRTGAGGMTLSEAVTFEEIDECLADGSFGRIIRPIREGLRHLPEIRVGGDDRIRVANGVIPYSISGREISKEADYIMISDENGEPLAVCGVERGNGGTARLRIERVFADPSLL